MEFLLTFKVPVTGPSRIIAVRLGFKGAASAEFDGPGRTQSVRFRHHVETVLGIADRARQKITGLGEQDMIAALGVEQDTIADRCREPKLGIDEGAEHADRALRKRQVISQDVTYGGFVLSSASKT